MESRSNEIVEFVQLLVLIFGFAGLIAGVVFNQRWNRSVLATHSKRLDDHDEKLAEQRQACIDDMGTVRDTLVQLGKSDVRQDERIGECRRRLDSIEKRP